MRTDLKTVQGTYTELWISKSEWRQEPATGDSIHLEIGGAGKPSILDKTEYFLEKAKQAASVMQGFPAGFAKLDSESAVGHEDPGFSKVWAITWNTARKIRLLLGKNRGVLLKAVSPDCEAVTDPVAPAYTVRLGDSAISGFLGKSSVSRRNTRPSKPR